MKEEAVYKDERKKSKRKEEKKVESDENRRGEEHGKKMGKVGRSISTRKGKRK